MYDERRYKLYTSLPGTLVIEGTVMVFRSEGTHEALLSGVRSSSDVREQFLHSRAAELRGMNSIVVEWREIAVIKVARDSMVVIN